MIPRISPRRLTLALDSQFLMIKTWPVEALRPVREIGLFKIVDSDAAEDTVLSIQSGSGIDTDETAYIGEGELVWVESLGLRVEFSTTPNITWNANKYLRIQQKNYDRRGSPNIKEIKIGGLPSSADSFRALDALAESVHYIPTNKVFGKDVARYDLIATGNLHYWFCNVHGDEYIKLVADAGIFTYTDDVPILFARGYVFDYNDIKAMV